MIPIHIIEPGLNSVEIYVATNITKQDLDEILTEIKPETEKTHMMIAKPTKNHPFTRVLNISELKKIDIPDPKMFDHYLRQGNLEKAAEVLNLNRYVQEVAAIKSIVNRKTNSDMLFIIELSSDIMTTYESPYEPDPKKVKHEEIERHKQKLNNASHNSAQEPADDSINQIAKNFILTVLEGGNTPKYIGTTLSRQYLKSKEIISLICNANATTFGFIPEDDRTFTKIFEKQRKESIRIYSDIPPEYRNLLN